MAKVPELMGAREVADALGVDRRNLWVVAGLPEPVQRLKSGPVWIKSEVDKLVKERKKLGRQ